MRIQCLNVDREMKNKLNNDIHKEINNTVLTFEELATRCSKLR